MTWLAACSFGLAVLCMTTMSNLEQAGGQPPARPKYQVKATTDFEVTGAGDNPAWRRSSGRPCRAAARGQRLRLAIQDALLVDRPVFPDGGTDRKLTATMNEDFMDLWKEDVFEVFLWTDERFPVYFEYRISPLNRELPILIPISADSSWVGGRGTTNGNAVTRKATSIIGGPETVAEPLFRGGAPSSSFRTRCCAAAERPAEAGQRLARKLLSHGPRRRKDDPVGVGAGRREFPRVPEVRRSGICSAVKRPRLSPSAVPR